MIKENKSKTRLFLMLLIIAYTFAWVLYIYLDYSTRKNDVLKSIDLRLYNSAVALKYIIPDDYHDRAIDEQAISIEEDWDITNKFNKYVRETGLKYVYTIIKKNGKLFFITSTAIVDPKDSGSKSKRGTYYFYDYTEEADKSFFEAFNRPTPTYQTNGVTFEQL